MINLRPLLLGWRSGSDSAQLDHQTNQLDHCGSLSWARQRLELALYNRKAITTLVGVIPFVILGPGGVGRSKEAS